MRFVAGMPSTDNGGSTGKIQKMVYAVLGYIFGMGDGINAIVNFLPDKAKLGVLDHRIDAEDMKKESYRQMVKGIIIGEVKESSDPTAANLIQAFDFIWFCSNQLNIAGIIEQDFVKQKDKFSDFRLQGQSVRNLDVLAVYYHVGAFDEKEKKTNEEQAIAASYVLENALGVDIDDVRVAHVVYVAFGECISYVTYREPIPDDVINKFVRVKKMPILNFLSKDRKTIYGQEYIDQVMHNSEVVDFGLVKSVRRAKDDGVVPDTDISHLRVSTEFAESLKSPSLQIFTLGAGSLFSSHLCQLATPGVVDIIIERRDLRKILFVNHVMMDETNGLDFRDQIQMIERIASRAVSIDTLRKMREKNGKPFIFDHQERLYRDAEGGYYVTIGDLFTDIAVNHDDTVVILEKSLKADNKRAFTATAGDIEKRYAAYSDPAGRIIFIEPRTKNKYFLSLAELNKNPRYMVDVSGNTYLWEQDRNGNDILISQSRDDAEKGPISVVYCNRYVQAALEQNLNIDLEQLSFYDQDYLLYQGRSEKGRFRGPIMASEDDVAYVVKRGIPRERIHQRGFVSMVSKVKKTETKGTLEFDRFMGLDPARVGGLVKQLVKIPNHIFTSLDIRTEAEELWEYIVYTLAKAIASHLKSRYHKSEVKVVVGRDSRESSPRIMDALCKGLAMSGIRVVNIASVNISSTPLVARSMSYYDADAGINVTASHLPEEMNGFKVVYKNRAPMSRTVDLLDIQRRAENGQFVSGDGDIEYFDSLSRYRDDMVQAMRERTKQEKPFLSKKIVVDPNNGTTCYSLVNILRELGAEVIDINNEPGAKFAHPGSPFDPETVRSVKDWVRKKEADMGFVFDCDGDRLIIIDNQGRVIRGGHYLMLME